MGILKNSLVELLIYLCTATEIFDVQKLENIDGYFFGYRNVKERYCCDLILKSIYN